MRYPLGEPVHERVPSQFMKLDELMIWMYENQFNGILVGESHVERTEVFITSGKMRHATNIRKSSCLYNHEALEVLFADANGGNLTLSLYKLSSDVCKPLMLPLAVEPRIDKVETKLVVISYLLDSCNREGLTSHIIFETDGSEGHMLFLEGKIIGAYTSHEMNLDLEARDFYALYNTRAGRLSLYQATSEELRNLKLPVLEFTPKNAELSRVQKLLVAFLDFARTAYGQNGLPPKQTMGLFKRIADSTPQSPVLVVDNEFRIISDTSNRGKLVDGLVSLLKKVQDELKNMWGPKVANSRYRRIYDSFMSEIKADPKSVEVIESMSPEHLGL